MSAAEQYNPPLIPAEGGVGGGPGGATSDVPTQRKRVRAGSISGRLRTASDLEEIGMIGRQEKGKIKDLIISGDSHIQNILEKYERGDKKELEDMIRSGYLGRRQSIDLLDDLDLDFLNTMRTSDVEDTAAGAGSLFDDDMLFDFRDSEAGGGVADSNSSSNYQYHPKPRTASTESLLSFSMFDNQGGTGATSATTAATAGAGGPGGALMEELQFVSRQQQSQQVASKHQLPLPPPQEQQQQQQQQMSYSRYVNSINHTSNASSATTASAATSGPLDAAVAGGGGGGGRGRRNSWEITAQYLLDQQYPHPAASPPHSSSSHSTGSSSRSNLHGGGGASSASAAEPGNLTTGKKKSGGKQRGGGIPSSSGNINNSNHAAKTNNNSKNSSSNSTSTSAGTGTGNNLLPAGGTAHLSASALNGTSKLGMNLLGAEQYRNMYSGGVAGGSIGSAPGSGGGSLGLGSLLPQQSYLSQQYMQQQQQPSYLMQGNGSVALFSASDYSSTNMNADNGIGGSGQYYQAQTALGAPSYDGHFQQQPMLPNGVKSKGASVGGGGGAAGTPGTKAADAPAGLGQNSGGPGYIGAYSPEQRKLRIEKFLEKRSRRVWTKKVKYDVRKNFADSRVRIKGRFVKKEDEDIMREILDI
mmetsp:Transcript_6877/g.11452  ORF Transcript_6877/g.11452 Transcript_6877/m.11452 type:complete len:642 (+) Transcript_6877:64-1989(+)